MAAAPSQPLHLHWWETISLLLILLVIVATIVVISLGELPPLQLGAPHPSGLQRPTSGGEEANLPSHTCACLPAPQYARQVTNHPFTLMPPTSSNIFLK